MPRAAAQAGAAHRRPSNQRSSCWTWSSIVKQVHMISLLRLSIVQILKLRSVVQALGKEGHSHIQMNRKE